MHYLTSLLLTVSVLASCADEGLEFDGSSDRSDQPATTSEITFEIKDLEDSEGQILLTICKTENCYIQLSSEEEADKASFIEVTVSIPENANGTTHFTTSLLPGKYAVLALHDQNGNGESDTDFFGLPTEGFGFSNNAHAGLGAPTYGEVSILVEAGTATVTTIDMDYLF